MAIPAQVFLLAAGRGRRAGGPKAWRDVDGKPALARHLEGLLPLFAGASASVQADWLDRCRALSARVRWVPVDPDLPALASVQALVRSRPTDEPGFLYHVDMPVFQAALFEALLAGLAGVEACVPVHEGRRGHPVLLSPSLYGPLAALDPAQDRLDEFLRSRRVAEVKTPDAAVLENRNR